MTLETAKELKQKEEKKLDQIEIDKSHFSFS